MWELTACFTKESEELLIIKTAKYIIFSYINELSKGKKRNVFNKNEGKECQFLFDPGWKVKKEPSFVNLFR